MDIPVAFKYEGKVLRAFWRMEAGKALELHNEDVPGLYWPMAQVLILDCLGEKTLEWCRERGYCL